MLKSRPKKTAKTELLRNLRKLAQRKSSPRCSIEEAIEEIRNGKMLIVIDSEDRENEGDLVMAAEDATQEAVNFMALHARGLICVPVTSERAVKLQLGPMVMHNEDIRRTAFTVSVDARTEITTGISAADRARTIRLLADDESRATDFSRPGHIFPLVAREGGVLVRAGHTEAAVDLARLAGKKPAGIICEIMNPDGSMSRMGDLEIFARKHDLKIVTIADLIEYRRHQEKVVYEIGREEWHSDLGNFTLIAFRTSVDDRVHLVFSYGEIAKDKPVLVRVHSENRLQELQNRIENQKDDIRTALQKIAQAGSGALLLIRERPNDLIGRLSQESQDDQKAEDRLRDTGIGAQILSVLGLQKIILLTDHPRPIVGLSSFGLEIVSTTALNPE